MPVFVIADDYLSSEILVISDFDLAFELRANAGAEKLQGKLSRAPDLIAFNGATLRRLRKNA
jgi:hypothetical protein